MSTTAKLSLCSSCAQSHFLRVSKTKVILLEILPFLTQAQKDNGERSDWFTHSHLQEVVCLLQQNVMKYYRNQEASDTTGDKKIFSRFIVTGTLLRAACVFKKRSEDDICLMSKKSKGSGTKFKEVNKLEDKLMVHVCPKTNSTVMNVSLDLVFHVPMFIVLFCAWVVIVKSILESGIRLLLM